MTLKKFLLFGYIGLLFFIIGRAYEATINLHKWEEHQLKMESIQRELRLDRFDKEKNSD